MPRARPRRRWHSCGRRQFRSKEGGYNGSRVQMLLMILKIAGIAAILVGWLPAMREVFAESRGLGYLSFMFPIVPLVFAFIHWEDLKGQAILMLSGGLVLGGGIALERFV
jgi:hypothetical protein